MLGSYEEMIHFYGGQELRLQQNGEKKNTKQQNH